jgi:sulfite exporter TauE/SafE
VFAKDQEMKLRNYIEVFTGVLLIVISISYIATNQENLFNNMAAISFMLAGIFMILKENWEWKKRKREAEDLNDEKE